jgi:hypothetical protein
MLKYHTLLRFSSPRSFISYDVSSYLKVSFESVHRFMDFSHGIRATSFLR